MSAEVYQVNRGPGYWKKEHTINKAGSHHAHGYVQLWPKFICKCLCRNLKMCHKMGTVLS